MTEREDLFFQTKVAAKSSFSWSRVLCQREGDAHRCSGVEGVKRQRLHERGEEEEEREQ